MSCNTHSQEARRAERTLAEQQQLQEALLQQQQQQLETKQREEVERASASTTTTTPTPSTSTNGNDEQKQPSSSQVADELDALATRLAVQSQRAAQLEQALKVALLFFLFLLLILLDVKQ